MVINFLMSKSFSQTRFVMLPLLFNYVIWLMQTEIVMQFHFIRQWKSAKGTAKM